MKKNKKVLAIIILIAIMLSNESTFVLGSSISDTISREKQSDENGKNSSKEYYYKENVEISMLDKCFATISDSSEYSYDDEKIEYDLINDEPLDDKTILDTKLDTTISDESIDGNNDVSSASDAYYEQKATASSVYEDLENGFATNNDKISSTSEVEENIQSSHTASLSEVLSNQNATNADLPYINSYIPINFEIEKVKIKHSMNNGGLFGSKNIPAKYDSRDITNDYGMSVISPIRDQGSYGLCWAFAFCGSVESYLRKNNLVKNEEESNLSEAALGYFMYQGLENVTNNPDYIDEPGVEGHDYTIRTGGFGNWYNGGNDFVAGMVASTYVGLAVEDENTAYENMLTYAYGGDGIDKNYAFNRNSYEVTNVKAINASDIEIIKENIMQNGSVIVAFCADSNKNNYHKYGEDYTFISDGSQANHGVCIVGWDDNIPKESFYREVYEGKIITAQKDGGWLIRNSWGGDPEFLNGGYFYLSYDDKSISEIYAVEAVPAGTYDYNYHYDTTTSTNCSSLLSDGNKVANVFKAYGSDFQTLDAVQLVLESANANYKIEIYVSDETMDTPTDGRLALTQIASHDTAGIYTVKLDEKVSIKPNTWFSVIITPNDNSLTIFGDISVDYRVFGGDASFNEVNPGESYEYNHFNGEWIDNYKDGDGFNWRIRALTNPVKIRISYDAGTDDYAIAMNDQPVVPGMNKLNRNCFIRQGYRFLHWIDDNGNVYQDNDDFFIENDIDTSKTIVLHAVWEPITNQFDYWIDCMVDDDTYISSKAIKKTYGIRRELPFAYKKNNSFIGWFLDERLTIPMDYDIDYLTTENGRLKVFPKFKKHSYTVRFNSLGYPYHVADIVKTIGEPVDIENNIKKNSGSECFDYWCIDAGRRYRWDGASDLTDKDNDIVEVYACFHAISGVATNLVEFYDPKTRTTQNQLLRYGEKVDRNAINEPIFDGAIFDGWYNGDVLWDFDRDRAFRQETRLVAKWIENNSTEYILPRNWGYNFKDRIKDIRKIILRKYPELPPTKYERTCIINGSNGLHAYLDSSNIYIYAPEDKLIMAPEDSSYLFSNPYSTDLYFSNCEGIINLKYLNTSKAISMKGMFKGLGEYQTTHNTYLDLSTFDTRNVKDMSHLFSNCRNICDLNLCQFDTSSVEDMSKMFFECNRIKGIYVSSEYILDSLTSSDDMFNYCMSIKGGNGTKYNPDNVDYKYAHIDVEDNPGYFSSVSNIDNSVYKIDLFTTPKTSYYIGETIKTSSMSIIVTKYDGNKEVIDCDLNRSYFEFSPSLDTHLTTENTSVTITYMGKSLMYAISVLDEINEVEILKTPRRIYKIGEKVTNLAGIELKVTTSTGEDKRISYNKMDFEWYPEFNHPLTINDKKLTIIYAGKMLEIPILVVADSSKYEEVVLHENGGVHKLGSLPFYKNIRDNLILPSQMIKNGYYFAGWYNNEECIGEVIQSIRFNEEGIYEYWAKWERVSRIEILSDKYYVGEYFDTSRTRFLIHTVEGNSFLSSYDDIKDEITMSVNVDTKQPLIHDIGIQVSYYGHDAGITVPVLNSDYYVLSTDWFAQGQSLTLAKTYIKIIITKSSEEIGNLLEEYDCDARWNIQGSFGLVGYSLIENYNTYEPESSERIVVIFGYQDKAIYAPEDSSYLFSFRNYGGGSNSCFASCKEISNFDYIDFSRTNNMSYMFSGFGCYLPYMMTSDNNYVEINFSNVDTSNVINMEYMFQRSYFTDSSINTISNFNVSKVTNMKGMFDGYGNPQELDLSMWDTSQLESTEDMFFASNFEYIDVSNWNNDKLKDISAMFSHMRNLKEVNMTGWTAQNVEDATLLFCGSTKLKQVIGLDNMTFENNKNFGYMFSETNLRVLNLKRFDTRRAIGFIYMFAGCFNLTTIIVSDKFLIPAGDVRYENMFDQCYNLVGGSGTRFDESDSYDYRNRARIDEGVRKPGYFTDYEEYVDSLYEVSIIKGGYPAKLDYLEEETFDPFGLRVRTLTLGGFAEIVEYTNQTKDDFEFEDVDTKTIGTNIITVKYKGITVEQKLFVNILPDVSAVSIKKGGYPNVTSYHLNEEFDATGLIVSVRRKDFSYYEATYSDSNKQFFKFENTSTDSAGEKIIKIAYKGVESSDDIVIRVYEDELITDDEYILPFDWLDLKVVNKSPNEITKISFVKAPAERPNSFDKNWSIDGSNGLEGYIAGTEIIIYAPENHNIYSPVDSSYLFSGNIVSYSGYVPYVSYSFSNLKTISGLELLSTERTKYMKGMFLGCQSLEEVNVISFDTTKVEDMSYMFCDSLKNVELLNLSSFDTSKVKCFQGMFYNLGANKINLSTFNTSSAIDMSLMFADFSGDTNGRLNEIDLSNFDTSNVTNMFYMVAAPNIESINLISFNTKKVKNFRGLFYNMTRLKEIDLSRFETSEATDLGLMFENCSQLEKIRASGGFVINENACTDNMFRGCFKIKGGVGTTYDENHINGEYARIDGGPNSSTPGYFTTVEAVEISTVELIGNKKPNKVSYYVGESFDATGLKVKVTNNNGSTEEIAYSSSNANDFEFSGADTSTAGSKTVRVKYKGFSVAEVFTITVKAVEISTVVLTGNKQPNKVRYYVGESFDATGLKVKVTNNNGSTEEIAYSSSNANDFEFSGADTSTAVANKIVSVRYKGVNVEGTFTITVKAVEISRVDIVENSNPTKLSYYVGESFDATGLRVKITNNNGSTEEIAYSSSNANDFEFSGADTSTAGSKTVRVKYKGFSVAEAFTIIVVSLTISSVNIVGEPTLKDYIVGDKLNPSGLSVEVRYVEDVSRRDLIRYSSSNASDFRFEPAINALLTKNDTGVKIYYKGQESDRRIELKVYELKSVELISTPSIVSYAAGTRLNVSGLAIRCTYETITNSSMEKEVVYTNAVKDRFKFKPALTEALAMGQKEVEVTYEGFAVKYEISVSAAPERVQNNNNTGSTGGSTGGSSRGGVLSQLPTNQRQETVQVTKQGNQEINMSNYGTYKRMNERAISNYEVVNSDRGLKIIIGDRNNGNAISGFTGVSNNLTAGIYKLTVEGEDKYYYLRNGGEVYCGWLKDENNNYHYFGSNGQMEIGRTISVGSKQYTFNKAGELEQGNISVEDKALIYSGAEVKLYTGVTRYNPTLDKWYVEIINPVTGEKELAIGLVDLVQEDGINTYYFGVDGSMQLGHQNIFGRSLYFDPLTGKMQQS